MSRLVINVINFITFVNGHDKFLNVVTIYNATLKPVLCWVKKAIELTLGATKMTQLYSMKNEHTCFQLLK